MNVSDQIHPVPILAAAPVRAALESMTAKNWRGKRDKLLASLLHDMI
ncbi:MAG: hypothetical protein Q7J98_09005 [Kiritimatiellia bacterium]|nr:hypothetical protein [Kiritimatiellia bacterium]